MINLPFFHEDGNFFGKSCHSCEKKAVRFPAHHSRFEKGPNVKEKKLLPSGAKSLLLDWVFYRMEKDYFYRIDYP